MLQLAAALALLLSICAVRIASASGAQASIDGGLSANNAAAAPATPATGVAPSYRQHPAALPLSLPKPPPASPQVRSLQSLKQPSAELLLARLQQATPTLTARAHAMGVTSRGPPTRATPTPQQNAAPPPRPSPTPPRPPSPPRNPLPRSHVPRPPAAHELPTATQALPQPSHAQLPTIGLPAFGLPGFSQLHAPGAQDQWSPPSVATSTSPPPPPPSTVLSARSPASLADLPDAPSPGRMRMPPAVLPSACPRAPMIGTASSNDSLGQPRQHHQPHLPSNSSPPPPPNPSPRGWREELAAEKREAQAAQQQQPPRLSPPAATDTSHVASLIAGLRVAAASAAAGAKPPPLV